MTDPDKAAKKKATDEWFETHKSTPGDYDDEAARLDMLLLLAFGSGFDAALAHAETQHAERLEAAERMIDAVLDEKVKLGVKVKHFFGEYRAKYPEPYKPAAVRSGVTAG